jgi:PAS domain S-box-containing protein/diguanylate cyclase (GGDEF)-like protein
MNSILLLDDETHVPRLRAVAAEDTLAPRQPTDPLDFRQVVEEADVGICIIQDELLQYVNPKYAQMHGWAVGELVGTDPLRLVPPAARARICEVRQLRNDGLHHAPYASRSLRRDGTVFDTRVFERNIVYRGRTASLTTLSDTSELARVHRVASWRAQMLLSTELLCRSGSIEIVLAHAEVRLSAGARALLQLPTQSSQAPLRQALRCIHREDRAHVLLQWRRAVPGKPFECHHRLLRADGSELRVLHRGILEVSEGDTRARPVAMLKDVTEQASARDRIDRLVNYHPVTGLATRTLLLERTAHAAEKALRDRRSVAMLYLRVPDVDRLHATMGLASADALATSLAARLVATCRSEDTVAHLGGGEFAILLEPALGAEESAALHTATRILATLGAPGTLDRAEFVAEGQIGIALLPRDGVNPAELLDHAHTACGQGGARINSFTREVGESAARRNQLDAALRRAFERNEFTLHYQPQVDLRDGTVVAVEALLRWHSEAFGNVSPAEFVPIAEESGLIVPLGEWVFRTACEQSVAWARAGLPTVRIGVNLSPRQLEQPDISRRLQAVMLETGANPAHLGIEVTESVLMRDLEHARRTLNELSAIGMEISLDDFGTGYSNLSVLRALPFDVLKIDRSLVHDVTASSADVSITRSVLMLAQGLKLKVLAEGVETEGQLNLLISNGCDLMQGYIFSKPLPPAQLEQLLRSGTRLPERHLQRGTRQPTLLLVDDEDNVLVSLRRALRAAGYQIVSAHSGPEGLAKLAEHHVDVILSDQHMPGMTGVEFLRHAKALYPDTVRMVLSGHTELQSITDAVNEGTIHKFLTKPWDDDLLREHVAEAFRRKNLSDENRRLSAEVSSANLELIQANERQQQMLAQQCERLSLEEVRALTAQDLIENLPTASIGIGADGTIVFVNRQARQLLAATPVLVGRDAADALPPDWMGAWRRPDGRHRPGRLGGRSCLLSCAPMDGHGEPRGHLLSVIPMPDHDKEFAA